MMEEIQPLTSAKATRDAFASANTQTTPEMSPPSSPEHPLPQQNRDEMGVNATSLGLVDSTPGNDAQAAGALNSSSVFHPLYSFPEDATGETGMAKFSNGSVVDVEKPLTDGKDEDGAEAVSNVSSPTDSCVRPPDSLRDVSVDCQGKEKRPSEPETQPLAETTTKKNKLSLPGVDTSPFSQLTSPGTSITPSHPGEDFRTMDTSLSQGTTVLHI